MADCAYPFKNQRVNCAFKPISFDTVGLFHVILNHLLLFHFRLTSFRDGVIAFYIHAYLYTLHSNYLYANRIPTSASGYVSQLRGLQIKYQKLVNILNA